MSVSPSKGSSAVRSSSALQILEQMQLEKAIGLTSTNHNSLCVNPVNGDVVYTAGCFLIIYNPKENKQVHHLQSRS